ncbi:hypothetical protein ACFL4L_04080 [bacterium]
MHCDGFQKYQLGKWSEQKFLDHIKTCLNCAEAEKKDHDLLDLARSLKTEVNAPTLWARIGSAIQQNIEQKEGYGLKSRWGRHPLFRMAAVLLLGIGLGLFLKSGLLLTQSGILSDSVLKRVEAHERVYESAIADLETEAGQQLVEMDFELMLLYRDRLVTIDEQIHECKTELTRNPANAHIRRYLLAALKDKKETLNEIIHWTSCTDPV